jgi:hypothetical protein
MIEEGSSNKWNTLAERGEDIIEAMNPIVAKSRADNTYCIMVALYLSFM